MSSSLIVSKRLETLWKHAPKCAPCKCQRWPCHLQFPGILVSLHCARSKMFQSCCAEAAGFARPPLTSSNTCPRAVVCAPSDAHCVPFSARKELPRRAVRGIQWLWPQHQPPHCLRLLGSQVLWRLTPGQMQAHLPGEWHGVLLCAGTQGW